MYQENMDLSLTKIKEGILKYHLMAILVALTIASIMVFGNRSFFPDKYEVNATVRVKTSALEAAQGHDERVSIIQEEILSRAVLEKVVEDLKLASSSNNRTAMQNMLSRLGVETKRKPLNPDVVIRDLQSSIIIQQSARRQQTELFVVSMTDKRPQSAASIVNAVVATYIAQKRGSDSASAEDTVEFLKDQVKDLQERFQVALRKLNTYKNLNSEILVDADTLDTALFNARVNLDTARTRSAELQTRIASLQQALRDTPRFLSDGAEVSEDNLSPVALKIRLENQLTVLRAKFTDTHPKIVDIKHRLSRLSNLITASGVSTNHSASNPEYVQLRTDLRGVQSQLSSANAEMALYQKQIEELDVQKRKATTVRDTLALLQTTKNEIEGKYVERQAALDDARTRAVAYTSTAGENFRVIDPAIVPSAPLVRSRMILYVFGIALGSVVGLGVAVLLGMILPEETSPLLIGDSKVLNVTLYVSSGLLAMVIGLFIAIDVIGQSLIIL